MLTIAAAVTAYRSTRAARAPHSVATERVVLNRFLAHLHDAGIDRDVMSTADPPATILADDSEWQLGVLAAAPHAWAD